MTQRPGWPEVVEFDEFDRLGRAVWLPAESARALAQTGLIEVLPAGRETWRLVPRGRVGSVRVDDLAIRVLPRASLGLTRLFFLLDHANGESFLDSAISASEQDELWTSVADSLAALTRDALSGGLLRGYRRVDESLRTVRGRIRLGDQIRRRPGMTIPLEVTYSEFTPNIPENRILRTAAHRLQFLPDLSDATRRRLSMVSARLSEASVIAMGAPIPAWTPSRLNTRYASALRLADRVVRSMSVEVQDGSAATAAFVAEMPEIFERFVSAELSRRLDGVHGGRLHVDPVLYLDTADASGTDSTVPDTSSAGESGRHRAMDQPGDHISVRTGLVYERDGEPLTTFVANYPTMGRSRADEHYRLLAACTALGVSRAYLVYPSERRDAVARPRRIVHTDISLIEYPIDLSLGPDEIRLAFDTLAAETRTLGTESTDGGARHRNARRRHAR